MSNSIRKKLNSHATVGKKEIEAKVAELSEIYANARRAIEQQITSYTLQKRVSFTGPRLVSLLNSLKKEYANLEQDYCKKFGEDLNYVAQNYYRDAMLHLGLIGEEDKILKGLSKERINLMMEDSFNHIAGATKNMQDFTINSLRQMSAKVMRESALTGASRVAISKRLLAEAGSMFQFIDRSNRKWDNKSYFEMLSRTMLHNNAREAYLNGCADNGSDIVRISVSGNPCKLCAPHENQLFSISGKTKDLPLLQSAIDAGLFHPNCTHRMIAVPDYIRKRDYNSTGLKHGTPTKSKAEWDEYGKEYRKKQNVKSARNAIDWKYAKQIDAHWAQMPPKHSKAILDYTDSDKHGLNKSLRNNTVTSAQAQEITTLSNALKDYPKFEGDVYRSVTFDTKVKRDEYLTKLQKNNYADEFSSTSVVQSTPKRYIYKTSKNFDDPNIKYPVCITIKGTKKGSYIGHRSKVPTDKEVLFDINTRFEVLDFSEKDGILYINAKEKD